MLSRTKLTIAGVAGVALVAATLTTAIGANRDNNGERRHGRGAPGELWQKAAELQKTLTAEQKAQLLAAPNPAMHGMRGNHPDGPPMMGKRGHDPMAALNLSDDQKSAIDAIRESYKTKFESLGERRRSGAITDEQFRTQAEALHTSMKNEVDAKLTSDQKATLEKMHLDGPHGGPGMRGDRPDGPPPGIRDRGSAPDGDAMAAALGLSAEQKTAVQALFEKHHTEIQALMEKFRSDKTDPQSMHSQMETLRQQHLAALDQILDDRQMEIVKIHDALMHKGGHRGGCHGGKPEGAPQGRTQQNAPNSSGSSGSTLK